MRLSDPCRALRCLALAALGASGLPAQTTYATITGSVADSSGALISDAEVTATRSTTGHITAARSNSAGVYTLPQLQEGEYAVRARVPGFKEYIVKGVVLVARDARRIDIALEVGAVETSVEVKGGASLIETETARISGTMSGSSMSTLPHNSQSLWNFLSISPLVVKGYGTSSTIRFAGSRDNQASYSMDGTSITDPNSAVQMSPLVAHIESFQEVRVDMANNTAEYGGIGHVTIISKSGGNKLHGSGFGYYSSPFFRSRNPFAAERDTGILYTAAVSAGGPVYLPKLYNGRNRTFFFYAYETQRGSPVRQLLNPTVPLPAWRAGDFSGPGGAAVRDPFAANAPFPNARIPASRIVPVAQKMQDRFYPLPNFGDSRVLTSQNYREQKSRAYDPTSMHTARADHYFTPRSFVYGRFSWVRLYNRTYESNLPTVGQRDQVRDQYSTNISYSHQLRSNLLNEFRYGFALNLNPLGGPVRGVDLVKELGLRGLAPDLPDISGIFKVAFTGLGLTAISQTDWSRNKYVSHQITDHLNWYRGRHSIKTGVNIGYVDVNNTAGSANLFGNMNFSNRFTGHPYADFLLGAPTTTSRSYPAVPINQIRDSWEFFATDDFKVHPKLSLSLGVRYQLIPAYREGNNALSVFDVWAGKIVVPDGALSQVSALLPRGYVDVVEGGKAGYPSTRLAPLDRNDFAPRIGIAWRPLGNDTVFRGGYGIFYDVTPRNANTGTVPFNIAEPAYNNPAGAPAVVLPNVFPGSVAGPTTVALPAAIDPHLRTPYSMQYNVTVEHQRWDTAFRISYVGTNTRKGHWVYDINQPVPDARPYADKPRLYPRYPSINYVTNGAGHQFHSGTVEVHRRMLRGIYYQFSYSLARDIGDLERNESPENSYDRKRERGVWQDIPTHRVNGSFILELPVGRGRRWLSSAPRVAEFLLGGWELNGIYHYSSGEFLTPMWTGPDPTGTAYSASRTPAQVTMRPDILRNPNLAKGSRTVSRWFDTAAFTRPSDGAFGTSAKGVVFGTPVNVLHAGLAKRFLIREGVKLRFEINSMNFLNHPNYSNPVINITSLAQVGVISGIGGVSTLDQVGARSFRAGLRLEW
jgi:hypothetical protein